MSTNSVALINAIDFKNDRDNCGTKLTIKIIFIKILFTHLPKLGYEYIIFKSLQDGSSGTFYTK